MESSAAGSNQYKIIQLKKWYFYNPQYTSHTREKLYNQKVASKPDLIKQINYISHTIIHITHQQLIHITK
jgi:hypothetical protein